MRLTCPLAIAQQLTLLAPVALFDAVRSMLGTAPRLRLKWPNDLLVEGAKVSGILLESANVPVAAGSGVASSGIAIVMGFGLNLTSHPAGLDQAATHLHVHGCTATPDAVLTTLAIATQAWLTRWDEGSGFDRVRSAWLERAGPIGEPLSIRSAPDPDAPRVFGRLGGPDDAGALLLDHADGSRSRHVQGDVALGAADR